MFDEFQWRKRSRIEAKMMMEASGMTVEKAVQEVMRMHKSLPARPGIEEIEAARSLIQNVEREDALKVARISQPNTAKEVPEELLKILQEMQRTLIHLHSREQKKEAQKLLDLESAHFLFDELIQRASVCLKSTASPKLKSTSTSSLAVLASFATNGSNSTAEKTVPPPLPSSAVYEEPMKAKDDSYLNKPLKASALRLDRVVAKARSRDVPVPPAVVDSSLRPDAAHGEYEYNYTIHM